MHCWTPATTLWIARSVQHGLLRGAFDRQGWEVRDDIKWLALYEPASETVILTEFPDDFPPGAGHKHAIWDRPNYHKQYFQPWQRPLATGEVHTYRMTVKAFHAP